jgi:hypothetical protein
VTISFREHSPGSSPRWAIPFTPSNRVYSPAKRYPSGTAGTGGPAARIALRPLGVLPKPLVCAPESTG